MREIEVQMFAAGVALAGANHIAIEVADNACVADVREALRSHSPALEPLLVASRWAVGTRFVDDTFSVAGVARLAMIPPVSGG